MNIAFLGTGYVGLTSGTCFAEAGHDVTCVDINPEIVQRLQDGIITIYEPGLEDLVKKNREAGRLKFTGDTKAAVAAADVIFIAVGTPPNPDFSVNLTYIEAAAKDIAEALPAGQYKVIVDKSTVPVKTGEKVTAIVAEHAVEGAEFDVVSNPEFLREGSAVDDFFKPDRIVVGTNSDRARERMWKIYETFPGERVDTDLNSAELIKHAANSFLALKISFINAVAEVCDAANADVKSVARGMGLDARIGTAFLYAGLGYGGSCFPKDIEAFLATSREVGVPFKMLEEVVQINHDMRAKTLKKMRDTLGTLDGKKIAVWGIAFKSNTDDIRESVAVKLIKELVAEGASIVAYDEKGRDSFRRDEKDFLAEAGDKVVIVESAMEAAQGADALLIATEWDEFRNVEASAIKDALAAPIVFDGRNLREPAEMLGAGIDYHCIGRAGAISMAKAALKSQP
ncbi:MAG: UDPglucose 6-dehydrogenase [Verrucomicrobiales bacterium]|jgi:UDPglucose 6-dehydrogenase